MGAYNKTEFSFSKMKDALGNICKRHIKIAQQMDLKLPSLPKLNLPKLRKIE